jgi:hypothetical protein
MQRKEFNDANDLLHKALTRLTPNGVWDVDKPYPTHGLRGELVGYLTQHQGRIAMRGFLGFERVRWILFQTYSWSWDGTIDEAWLIDKIANSPNRSIWALSNPNWAWSIERDGTWVRG